MEKESKWSKKYKDSIDCSKPKGFSQRAHCQGLKKKKSKASILDELNRIAHHLENQNEIKLASIVDDVFYKVAKDFKEEHLVPFKMNLDDALNNYDSENYQVDATGNWADAEPISKFRKQLTDKELHQPAEVDDNHLIFYNEEEDHVEVMNMIPEHHLDTLHDNPDEAPKFIKRADD
jgi:hypothetical protein